MIYTNRILLSDSYKFSHFKGYPPNTKIVYSYLEARQGAAFPTTLFFGLQSIIKSYLLKPITIEEVNEAESFAQAHGVPFNREGWMRIVEVHGGKLPVEIRAVAEGSLVPVSNVLMTVQNTDPELPWLTNFLETLLMQVWYPSTVATLSHYSRQIILKYLEETSEDPQGQINFKLHDFGFRGVSSVESAGLGAAAHLINFMGTDTIAGITLAKAHYGAEHMPGFSIPAAEHSTITSWGTRPHANPGFDEEEWIGGETAAYANMVLQFGGPGKIYAVVSDSYDLHNAVENIWGKKLKNLVLEKGGTLVVRPDSGDPMQIVLQTVEKLGAAFGYTVNAKGFRVLNPAVRVIQGDGINIHSLEAILRNLKEHGWSVDNVAFGMGGGLLQQVNRDTQRFAMKCSAALIGEHWYGVSKNPATDPSKASKVGRLALIKDDIGGYRTVAEVPFSDKQNQLKTVYLNGELVVDQKFEEIKQRAAS
jgi:nicotinamide phosphoribosyltransferase